MYHIYSFEKLEVYALARKFKIEIKLLDGKLNHRIKLELRIL
jgi:hypothetical protein